MISLNIITDYEQFISLNQEWNDLVANSTDPHVFFTHEWFDCWWQAFCGSSQLYIFTLRKNKTLIAIAPFMICKTTIRGFPVKVIQFMANDDSPRCDIIINKRIAGRDGIEFKIIFDYLINTKYQWDIIFFNNIARDSKAVQALLDTKKSLKLNYICETKLCSPWISFNSDWDSFYSSLKRRTKMTINNVRNRIHKMGEVAVIEYKTDKLREISAISQKAWKITEGKSYLNRADRKLFIELLTNVAQKQGWLSLWLLYVKNKPVAYEYHLRYLSREIALIAEYDKEYYKNSPGAFLDVNIIKCLFESDITEYDFGGSLDQYKKKWKPNLRYTNDYYIYNNSAYSKFLFLFEKYFILFLKNKIKASLTVIKTYLPDFLTNFILRK